jgi:alkylation response protein AidB-like acyl-CoA dehydrogenase
MEFAFSEDQLAFRDAVRDLLAGTCSPEAVRAAWDAEDPWDSDRWDALVDMGVVGLTMAEADGGLGLTEVDLVLLLEEAGRAALPEPLMESALLARHVPSGASAKVAHRPTPPTLPERPLPMSWSWARRSTRRRPASSPSPRWTGPGASSAPPT